ncbi:DUF4238 domain-containing protein [Streptomyces sp. NPDC001601]|uniref:DUF4238 domain-containing protein n=1 Tax=Streptomyces sp. NPDC001601 TaxID=3364592 RepID=UPI0036AE6133
MSKRHHYIPACYLGRFSDDTHEKARLRRIHVARFTTNKIYLQKADQVGAINNFYRIKTDWKGNPLFLEESWQGYETKLSSALDQLEEMARDSSLQLSAECWLRTLVPFVTGLLVRGPDFNQRFDRRILSGYGENKDSAYRNTLDADDNTNIARMMELQRLLAGTIASDWQLLISPDKDLITNDLGYAIEYSPADDRYGYVIPLSPHVAISLTPRRHRDVLLAKGISSWVAPIGRRTINGQQAHALNVAVTKRATDFIAGRTLEQVIQYAPALSSPRAELLNPQELGFPYGRLALIHEFTWYRLTSILQYSPYDSRVADFGMDWEYLASDWCPNPAFATNLHDFPTGLTYRKGVISLTLFDVDGFSVNRSPKGERIWFKSSRE